MKKQIVATLVAAAFAASAGHAIADSAAAEKWVNDEFQPSAISKDEQMAEMEWFIKAAEPFKGMEVNVLSEGIPTHDYESKTLTKAFEEITGIRYKHKCKQGETCMTPMLMTLI